MPVQYFLRRRVLGDERMVELSQSSYQEIAGAVARLLETLFIEEKFSMMLGNWIELEQHLLTLGLNAHVSAPIDWSAGVEQVFGVNRRLVNLMSSCRVYVDHAKHSLSMIYGSDGQQFVGFKEVLSQKYEASSAYRTMEALRNYTQHRGMPVREIRSSQTLVRGDRIRHCVAAFLHTEEVAADKDFKPSVAEELLSRGKKIDLRPVWRTYIECLGQSQGHLRERMAEDIAQWENTVHKAISLFRDTFGDDVVGLAAYSVEENGEEGGTVPVFSDFIERRQMLQLRTPKLDNLSLRYVSSEVVE